MRKNLKKLFIAFFILFFLICVDIYVCAIDAIPTSVILFQGEDLNVKTILGITITNNQNR